MSDSGSPTVSMSKPEADTECHETRVRYFHHVHNPDQDVSIKYEKITKGGKEQNHVELFTTITDTIVKEYRKEDVVRSLRLLLVNHSKIGKWFFKEYEGIVRLEIGCPLSIEWLFKNIARFPNLKQLRLGKQFWWERGVNRMTDGSLSVEANHSVICLEIDYDPKYYSKLASKRKVSVDVNFTEVLRMSKDCFPSLREATIQVPRSVETQLGEFVKNFKVLEQCGQKRSKAAEDHVYFICSPKSIAQEAPRDPRRRRENKKQICVNTDAQPSSSKANRRASTVTTVDLTEDIQIEMEMIIAKVEMPTSSSNPGEM